MKTNKLLAGMLTATLVATSIGTSFAMYGERSGKKGEGMFNSSLDNTEYFKGNGKGKGKGQGKGKGKKYGKSKAGKEHNISNVLGDIEKQDVNAIEIDLLKKQYEEEMMANELYKSFYDKYGVETFKKISESEANHMEAVKALLDRYEIAVPTNYDHIESLYNDLKAKGSLSLKDAIEVGIQIEIVDIDDIVKAIKSTDNNDIKVIFTKIGGASYNHMRGFVKTLDKNNLTTDIDYSNYLSSENTETRGPLHSLLIDKLEEEGVELPELAKKVKTKGGERLGNGKKRKGFKGNNKKRGKNNKNRIF